MVSIRHSPQAHFTPVSSLQKSPKSTFGSIIRKICAKIISILTCKRACSPSLKSKHIQTIKDFNQKKLLAFPQKLEVGKVQPVKVEPPKFNETLEGMREFAQEMMSLTIDCLQSNIIEPKLKEFDKIAPHIPKFLKNIAKQAVSIGTVQAKPIFEIIRKYRVDKKAMDQLGRVLNWLLKDTKPEEKKIAEFKEKLKDKIKEIALENEVKDRIKPGDEAQFNACSDKILDWLLHSDHQHNAQDPFKLFDGEAHPPSEELITQVLQGYVLIFIEEKINLYTSEANKVLQNDLPEIIETTMRKNAEVIIDLFSSRMAEVIQNLGDKQFTVLFDKIVEIAGTHVTRVVNSEDLAEKAARDHQALEEYAQKIVKSTPKSAKEKEVYEKCQKYLDDLKNRGGVDGFKKDVLFSSYIHSSGYKSASIETKTTAEISNLITEILFPTIIKDGKPTSGLEDLLEKIEFPQKFKDLIKEGEDIAKEILSEEAFKEVKELGQAASGFKSLAFESCAELIKIGLNEAVELVVKQMSKPEELNLMITNSALPSALSAMFKFFADDLILAKINQLAPLFQGLPNKKKEETLLKKLFEIAKREAPQFNFVKEHEEVFFDAVRPRIQEIAELLTEIKKGDATQSNLKSTIAIVKEYYKVSDNSKENNPHFADFIDIALSTGEFGTLLPRLFKRNSTMVSTLITNSVKGFRKQYRPILNLMIPAGRDKYLKKEVIEKWVAYLPSLDSLKYDIENLKREIGSLDSQISKEVQPEKKQELESKRTKKKNELTEKRKEKEKVIAENVRHEQELHEAKKNLPIQIDKVSRLGYDMLMFKAKAKVPLIGGFLLRKVFGDSAEKLNRVILTLFNKIIGRQTFNEHLLSKIFLTTMTGLQVSNSGLQGTTPLLQKEGQEALSAASSVPISAQFMDYKPFIVDIAAPKKKPLWKRIFTYVIEKFKSLFSCFVSKKITLSKHQLNLMEFHKPEGETVGEMKELKGGISSKKEVGGEPKKQVEDPKAAENQVRRQNIFKENPELNASLQKVGSFVSDFMKELSETVYSEKIAPFIQSIKKNSADLPDQVKQMLDWINKILAPVANSIVKNLTKEGQKKQLDEVSKGFLSNLFKNLWDEKGDLKKDALEEMKRYLTLTRVNLTTQLSENDLEKYITALKLWVSQPIVKSEKLKSLETVIAEQEEEIAKFPYEESCMRHFYIAAIQWLVDSKIKSHVGGLQNFLNEKLAPLIKTHLDKNLTHMTRLLFNQVAGLINNIPDEDYKNFFDESADIFNLQMENLITAKEKIKKNFSTEEEKKEAIAKELTTHNYKLHPLAVALLHPPAEIKTPQEIQAYKALQEKIAFEQIVKRMMKLALPRVQKNDHEIDAYRELWDNIIIEPEVLQAIEDVRQFVKSLFPEKYADKVGFVENKLKKLAQKFVLGTLEQQGTKMLAEKLQESFKLISNEKLRKEFLSENFSLIQKQLIRAFFDLIIIKNEPKKLFNLLLDAETKPQEKEQKLDKLNEKIFKLCQEGLHHSWDNLNINFVKFKQEHLPDIFRGLTRQMFKEAIFNKKFPSELCDGYLSHLIKNPEDEAALGQMIVLIKDHLDLKFKTTDSEKQRCFNEQMRPLIIDISNHLREKENACRREKGNVYYELTHKEIETALDHYFRGENDKNTKYVTMLANMTKLGQFGKYKFILDLDKVKEALTGVLVPALHPIRASLRAVTDATADSLRAQYLNGHYIKDLVTAKSLKAMEKKKTKIEEKIQEIKVVKDDPNLKDDVKKNEYGKKIETLSEKLKKVEGEIKAEMEVKEKKKEMEPKIEEKYNKGLELTTKMIYDIIEYSINKATHWNLANKGIKSIWNVVSADPEKGIWNAVVDPSPTHLGKSCEKFLEEIFKYEELNMASLLQIMENALDLVEKKNPI